jgi:hypothetical protein
MKIKKGFILKQIANQHVVFPVGEATINFNGMITLNNTAKILFEAMQSEQTVDSLVKLLTDKFDVDKDTATKDVNDFINILESNNILE